MTTSKKQMSYSEGILNAFQYLLRNHKDVFVMGQGLWSPWYVGSTMSDLEKEFGKDRVIDTPVSELGCTGAAIGASLCGFRPIMVHPRMDFMILAADQIVNQAAKWNHMLGGQASPRVTIRSIINRGGEQGAQHSQALHSWYAHIPGLRVVMPATALDARDLLIASVLCDDPVVYIDDRWLYDRESYCSPISHIQLEDIGPIIRKEGTDVSLVACGYSEYLCELAAEILRKDGMSAEVIDVRVLNPLEPEVIISSVKKTGRLIVVDGGWPNSGFAAEIIASVCESVSPNLLKAIPKRITLPAAPAPTSKPLEAAYYPSISSIVDDIKSILLMSYN